MFSWLWRRLGLSRSDPDKYDAVYGYPKKAVADWLQWNPELAAAHKRSEDAAAIRRNEGTG